jgi:hypothetical protein
MYLPTIKNNRINPTQPPYRGFWFGGYLIQARTNRFGHLGFSVVDTSSPQFKRSCDEIRSTFL